jgi:hypothetical protein
VKRFRNRWAKIDEFKYFVMVYALNVETIRLNRHHSNVFGRKYTCKNIFPVASFGAPGTSGRRSAQLANLATHAAFSK